MNENNYVTGMSTEAIERLQAKRKAVTKKMFLIIFGAFFLIIPPIGLAIVLFGAWRVGKLRKEMKGLYKDAFVREPLMNNFENVVYEPDGGFLRENVESFRLCEMGDIFASEDYIRASYAGVPFEVAEVKVGKVTGTDEHPSSETYFEGRMMVFHFPDKLVSSVTAFSKKFKHRALSRDEAKHEKVELESMQFNDAFDVYSQTQQDAFYLITPHFMERLMVLAGKYESIGMKVIGNRIFLGFNEPGKNVFDANIEVGQLNIEQEMAKVQAEIEDIKVLISLILNLKTYA